MKNAAEETTVESGVKCLPAQIVGTNTETVLDFDAIFDAYMEANEKQWAHDRSKTVGASEVWDCLRKIWYEKRAAEFGIEPDEYDENWGAMERGNIIENHFVVPGLRLALPKAKTLPPGVELLIAGDDQQTLVLGKNSATPDGVIKGLRPGPLTIRGGDQVIYIPDIKSDCIILEIKSIDPRATLLEERAKHHGQTQVQIGLIREMTPHKPFFSVVLYIDASFLNKFTPFVVEFDESMYAVSKERAASVYAVNDPLMVYPEGRFSGACEHCRWRGPCQTNVVKNIPSKFKGPSDPKALEETDPLVRDFLATKEEYARLERELEIKKERIKESLLDHKTSQLQANDWKVTWFPVKGKTYLDTKALEADGIDLKKYQKEGLPHDQLRVTPQLPKTAPEKKPRKKKAEKA